MGTDKPKNPVWRWVMRILAGLGGGVVLILLAGLVVNLSSGGWGGFRQSVGNAWDVLLNPTPALTPTPTPLISATPTITPSPTLTPSITPSPTPTITPTPDMAPAFVNRLRPRSELVTTDLSVATIRLNVTTRQGPANTCGREARYAVEATFRAGLDLTTLTPDAIQYDATNDTFIVTLPGVQLLNCQIDDIDRYLLVGPVGPTCNRDEAELERLARYNAINALREEVLAEGFLIRAQSDAQTAIIGLLGNVTTSNIQVQFGGIAPPLPVNCQPMLPAGWNFVNGEWIPAPQ